MNYLDLFSGIGGFHEGLWQAGFEFEKTYFSEIDKYAKSIYRDHFPDSVDLGDINEILSDQLSEIDLVTFGFPCQDLSIAGKRGGIKASRSGLFFEAMRIIGDVKPKYFIFENVKGLLSSNRGKDFETVLREVAKSGYDGQWQVLNTRWFLPQNRERVYFVGHIRGESRPKIFPITERTLEFTEIIKMKSNKNNIINTEVICTDTGASKEYQNPMINCSPALKSTRCNYEIKLVAKRNRKDGSFSTFSMSNNVYGKSGISPCLSIMEGGGAVNYVSLDSSLQCVRKLTPVECERLQGFEDNWTRWGKKENGRLVIISDSQRYKCIGNAVSIPIVKIVGLRLLRSIT